MDETEYRGIVKEKLQSAAADIGSPVLVSRKDGFTVEGRVLPRYMLSSPDILVIKLSNGYNIGVKIDDSTVIEKIDESEEAKPSGTTVYLDEHSRKPPEKKVYIVGTGGTIASRIDYRTGAVYPYISTEELLQAVPELHSLAEVEVYELYNIFSEDMTPRHWSRLAEKVYDLFEKGATGIVVAHGTDTMGYTAAALAFAFRETLPGPLVFTGSQRSSDRPSSDSAFNIISSVLVASRSDVRESIVVMHGVTGDDYALAHRGVRVRKMHTSRRDAFQSINTLPLLKVYPEKMMFEQIGEPLFRKPFSGSVQLKADYSDKVGLVKHYPGMNGEMIDMLVDRGYQGIVIEGTGFGHVSNKAIKSIERAVDNGIPVISTSQCIFGRVNLNVYSTGRRMLRAGVIPAEDMLSETAYVKLSWLLGQGLEFPEIKRLFRQNIVGEMDDRTTLRSYPRWYHG
ncbi:MAG: Glu-tRNA(Gln) amidotransferase subunit GatD [Desulfurococcales archaeon]|nr:Glu-tRNA(Gln) amidotransferase subunit GatD [Desulfurococcales archaeon]